MAGREYFTASELWRIHSCWDISKTLWLIKFLKFCRNKLVVSVPKELSWSWRKKTTYKSDVLISLSCLLYWYVVISYFLFSISLNSILLNSTNTFKEIHKEILLHISQWPFCIQNKKEVNLFPAILRKAWTNLEIFLDTIWLRM